MNEQELKEIEEQIHSCPSNEYGCDCCPKRLYIPKLIQEIRRLNQLIDETEIHIGQTIR